MKPKPLASLNHLTVPVVRIVLLLTSVVIGVRTCAVPTDYAARESSPHAGRWRRGACARLGNGSQNIKKGRHPTPAPSLRTSESRSAVSAPKHARQDTQRPTGGQGRRPTCPAPREVSY